MTGLMMVCNVYSAGRMHVIALSLCVNVYARVCVCAC